MNDKQLANQLNLLHGAIQSADESMSVYTTLSNLRDNDPGYKGRHDAVRIGISKSGKMNKDVYRRTLALFCGKNPEIFTSSWQLTIRAADTLINFLYRGEMTWNIDPQNPINFKTNPPLDDKALNLILYCKELAERQLKHEAYLAEVERGQLDLFAQTELALLQEGETK